MNCSGGGEISEDQEILLNLISAPCDWVIVIMCYDYRVILNKIIKFLIKDDVEQN